MVTTAVETALWPSILKREWESMGEADRDPHLPMPEADTPAKGRINA